jgi:hypothetical protein
MIKTESVTINRKAFIRTYSDSGYMIERDGIRYSEAVDPAELNRQYTETDEPVEELSEVEEEQDAVKM